MKKLIIALTVALFFSSCADLGLTRRRVKDSEAITKESVPTVIQDAFLQKYPSVTADQWFKINDILYAARYAKNGKKTYVFFSNKGVYIDDEDIDQYDYDMDDDYLDGWDYFTRDEY
jgi:hypothetical protein